MEATAAQELTAGDLGALSDHVIARLKQWKPATVAGVDPALHYLPPHVPKVVWTKLGDFVTERERDTTGCVPGNRWFSLRLDGANFGSTVKSLRRRGVLEPEGFSAFMAAAMQSLLGSLMTKFHAVIGYTQSDELTVFVPPTNLIQGQHQAHERKGRVTKLTTLAAGFATACFNAQLALACTARGVPIEELAAVLPHFDCRMGNYASWEEAQGLLLWRAYDCSVNGASDAVHQIKGSGRAVQSFGTREKIAWLASHGRLPLPAHQAYGTLLTRVRRIKVGHDPRRDAETRTLRWTLEALGGSVLHLARTDSLFPEPDVADD